MSQRKFLLTIFIVSIVVGGYFFYLSQRSYQNYKILNKKIVFLTQELQNIRIEKSKLQFQLSAVQNNRNLDSSLFTSKDLIAQNEVIMDIIPPDLNKGSFDFKSYISYMILLSILILYFIAYYFEFNFLDKFHSRLKQFFSKFQTLLNRKRPPSEKRESSPSLQINLQTATKEEVSSMEKKKKLFTLKMLR